MQGPQQIKNFGLLNLPAFATDQKSVMCDLHIIAQIYRPTQRDHLDRMIECIEHNASLEFVRRITLLDEDSGVYWANDKVHVIPVHKRASYADLLTIAASPAQQFSSHYALLNSDIIISDDILKLLQRVTSASTVAAITRRELDGELRLSPQASQDAWIMKAHELPSGLLDACYFRLGIAGCENLFAMSLYAHGYNLWNPCGDCTILHNDPQPRMSFPEWVYGAYLWLPACNIEDVENSTPSYELRVIRRESASSQETPSA
jgi:hypothetical protein